MKQLKYGSWIVLITLFISQLASAQGTRAERKAAEESLVKKSVESKQYVFTARSANPIGGRSINLTSTYEMRVYGDTLICDLPFFGKAYSGASLNNGGINFTSTQFTYQIDEARKGGWDIKIKPSDASDVRELTLFISPSGYSTLNVLSNTRSSISFYGTVTERKYKKKK